MKLVIVLFVIFFHALIFTTNDNVNYVINFQSNKNNNVKLEIPSEYIFKDSISFFDNSKKVVFKAKLLDKLGKMTFLYIDSVGKYSVKGSFTNGLDTLKKQTLLIDYSSSELVKYVVVKYIEPIPDGTFEYFDFKNRRIKRLVYEMGGYSLKP